MLLLSLLLLLFAVVLLYIPVVQQNVAEKIFECINDKSGYEIKTGFVRLKFPLDIEVGDFEVAKSDSLYAKGKNIAASIALLPLLNGDIEVNYVTIEKSFVDSKELIPNVRIKGKVGYLRAVARNVSPEDRRVALRQVYILDSDISVELADTVKKRKEAKGDWNITLHKGRVVNSNVEIYILGKAASYSLAVNHLQLKQGEIDLGRKFYRITSLDIENSNFQYHYVKESGNAKSLSFTNIDSVTKNLIYSPQKSNIEIESMQFTAPGDVDITKSNAVVVADSTSVQVKEFFIASNNGSYITATADIPWNSIKAKGDSSFNGEIFFSLNKKEFEKIFTKEQYSKLAMFKENFLTATVVVSGNTKKAYFKSDGVDISSLALLDICGCFENYNNEQTITAECEINMIESSGRVKSQARYLINDNSYKIFLDIREFSLNNVFPNIPLEYADIALDAEGKGFEILNNTTECNINLGLDSVIYDGYSLCDININATQERGCATVGIKGNKTRFRKGEKFFTLDDFNILFATGAQKSDISLKNGDLAIIGYLEYNYTALLSLIENREVERGSTRHCIEDYTKTLPAMQLSLTCGENNILYKFMTANGLSMKSLDLKLRAGNANGIEINGEMIDFRKDDIKFDTIKIFTQQNNDTIKYISEIYSTIVDAKKRKNVYNATLYGNLFNDSLTTFFTLRDNEKNIYIKFGTKTGVTSQNIKIAFVQDAIFFGNSFTFNEKNFISIHDKGSVKVDIILNGNNITYQGKQSRYRTSLTLTGDYINNKERPRLNGSISVKEFPLELINILIKNKDITLDGYINSEVIFSGGVSEPLLNGYIQFNESTLDAPLFGTELYLSETPINIVGNRLLFNNFNIYAKGENPFTVEGYIDMNVITNPEFDLRMKANDYEILNTPRQADTMLYGKLSVELAAFIKGTPERVNIGGKAVILRNSNITYVLQKTPISSGKELDGVVEFVNFNDTAKVDDVKKNINIGDLRISMVLKVDDGARLNVDFDKKRNNYLTLQGGGNVNMSYNHETGFVVTGNYTMEDGELKYQLPIIPLKTFNIRNGSKVTWNGDVKNPTLDITALERVVTSVTTNEDNVQPVAFDVGVKLSNTLENMGLSFIISAPDNAMVQEQLNTLDEESMNKYAITMLITGAYIGNSNTMAVSNALNSLLDAKINELASSAIKSVSVNIGINDARNPETGDTYKNYSFNLRKRFRNDRVTLVIGGELNDGNNLTNNESFINNASLEWKIGNSGNMYIKLFYEKNYESLLEGEITEGGIGFLYKRKVDNLKKLLIFNGKKRDERMSLENHKEK